MIISLGCFACIGTVLPSYLCTGCFIMFSVITNIYNKKTKGPTLTFRHHSTYMYIGQIYRNSQEYAFYIFSQQIDLIIFLEFFSPSSFIPPQNVVYFLMLLFLVHRTFTFYINDVLNCKCPAPGPKG